jgi:acyl-CoA reductase-like NAD-dependent aldehyde dehydrogenase
MKAFALALVAGIATCQNSNNTNSDWKSVVISVNETAVETVYADALQFGQLWAETTRGERSQVRSALADAYKNTNAKLILNFGKTVVPAVKSWADLASNF